MIFCLFYVSECVVPPADVDRTIKDVVRDWGARNSEMGITGALLFSGSHFAHFLEGAEEDVRSAMREIERHECHKNPVILLEESADARQFATWSLVFSRRSSFVQRRLDPLLYPRDPGRNGHAVREVVSMLREFAAD